MPLCPYKGLSGFTFIMNYSKYIFPIMARNDGPFKTWKEFKQWARKNPRTAYRNVVENLHFSHRGTKWPDSGNQFYQHSAWRKECNQISSSAERSGWQR
jgi:hypothetical protein